MKYAVGDRVVHQHHGPGRIASIEQKELLDGSKRYYVIEVPDQALTIQIPVRGADESGLRPAMSPAKLAQALRTLGDKPAPLPDDYKERQEEIGAKLQTSRVTELAEVVRDHNWHRARAHLTKKDMDQLRQGQEMLAAEMALVSGDSVSEASELIDATVQAAIRAHSGE
jgi:CarD family transcriptional regulator